MTSPARAAHLWPPRILLLAASRVRHRLPAAKSVGTLLAAAICRVIRPPIADSRVGPASLEPAVAIGSHPVMGTLVEAYVAYPRVPSAHEWPDSPSLRPLPSIADPLTGKPNDNTVPKTALANPIFLNITTPVFWTGPEGFRLYRSVTGERSFVMGMPGTSFPSRAVDHGNISDQFRIGTEVNGPAGLNRSPSPARYVVLPCTYIVPNCPLEGGNSVGTENARWLPGGMVRVSTNCVAPVLSKNVNQTWVATVPVFTKAIAVWKDVLQIAPALLVG
jgi:hypothetical protein